jgi:cysteine desulfurase family protein
MSIAAAQAVEEARDTLAELLNVADPARISFTKNATEALNIAIYGSLASGDHAVTTSIEHNSVMRPLRHLQEEGVELTVVRCAPDGSVDPDQIADAMRPNTRLVVTTHGSNVTGTLLPIGTVASMTRGRGVPYLVDASQTAGAVPIDVGQLGVDMLACTGHKSLLGPTGTGALYVSESCSPRPLTRGGTGSRSDLETQPDFMPDMYEAGTLNVAGLIGLDAGMRYLIDKGVDTVEAHEASLVARFVAGASEIPGLTIYGPADVGGRCGVLSFNVTGLASSDVSMLLDRDFDVMSRSGLHCSPGAHRTIGTFPTGTTRFGFSYANTTREIDQALAALEQIAAWAASRPSSGVADDG